MNVEQSRDSPLEERRLLQLAAAGDARAFRSIVQAYASTVAGVITSMLGPGDDADDAGQETFIRLMRALPTFRGDSVLRTFVTRIAMNVSLDALARRKRDLRFVSLGSTEDTGSGDVHSVDRTADEEEDQRARAQLVQRAVDSLDGKHRAVVVMRLLEQRSTKESAQLLGIPEGTVMSRLTRAMQKLEHILRPVLDR
ncbi:MAG: RNA polymerase sigma factor [Gemmatimonas sp.]